MDPGGEKKKNPPPPPKKKKKKKKKKEQQRAARGGAEGSSGCVHGTAARETLRQTQQTTHTTMAPAHLRPRWSGKLRGVFKPDDTATGACPSLPGCSRRQRPGPQWDSRGSTRQEARRRANRAAVAAGRWILTGAGLLHTFRCKEEGVRLRVFSLHLLSHFLLQETDRPSDVNGGPVSASQPRGLLSGPRGDPDGRRSSSWHRSNTFNPFVDLRSHCCTSTSSSRRRTVLRLPLSRVARRVVCRASPLADPRPPSPLHIVWDWRFSRRFLVVRSRCAPPPLPTGLSHAQTRSRDTAAGPCAPRWLIKEHGWTVASIGAKQPLRSPVMKEVVHYCCIKINNLKVQHYTC